MIRSPLRDDPAWRVHGQYWVCTAWIGAWWMGTVSDAIATASTTTSLHIVVTAFLSARSNYNNYYKRDPRAVSWLNVNSCWVTDSEQRDRKIKRHLALNLLPHYLALFEYTTSHLQQGYAQFKSYKKCFIYSKCLVEMRSSRSYVYAEKFITLQRCV